MTAHDVLSALASGVPVQQLHSALAQLPPAELQRVLCTACSMLEETGGTSMLQRQSIDELICCRCRMYTESGPCQIGLFYRLSLHNKGPAED